MSLPLAEDGIPVPTAWFNEVRSIFRGKVVADVSQFGAVGDGVTDDYAAFVAAHDALPSTGGVIIIPSTPTNRYRLSQAWNLRKLVHVYGTLVASGPNTLDPNGTVLVFDADKRGIIVNSFNTIDDTTTDLTSSSPSASFSIIERIAILSKGGKTGLANGGTGIDVDGIHVRAAGVTLRNLWVQDWKRNGIRIAATIGAGGAFEGSANTWRAENCSISTCGSHGFYVDGGDANAGLALSIDSGSNDGYGIYDTSFLGNTYVACHVAGNIGGAYKTDKNTGANLFLGCYSEGLSESHFVTPTVVIGGILASGSPISSTSTAWIVGAGNSQAKAYQHITTKGAQDVGSQVGVDGAGLSAWAWGVTEEGASLGAQAITYDNVNKYWMLQGAGSAGYRYMMWPAANGGVIALRANAPLFPNGIYFGEVGANLRHMTTGSAAPVAGTWVAGDIVWNGAPTAGGKIGFVCVTGGTPGTWKAFGVIDA